jgi:hypothetical protein
MPRRSFNDDFSSLSLSLSLSLSRCNKSHNSAYCLTYVLFVRLLQACPCWLK